VRNEKKKSFDFRNRTKKKFKKKYLDFLISSRYGFIHTEKLSEQFDEIEKKEKEVEYQRAQKWLKMLKNFEKFSKGPAEKLHKRIFKGIPDKLRPTDTPQTCDKLTMTLTGEFKACVIFVIVHIIAQFPGVFEITTTFANATAPNNSNYSTSSRPTASTTVNSATVKECRVLRVCC
jgi:hypothetical protein